MQRTLRALPAILLVVGLLGACGEREEDKRAAPTTTRPTGTETTTTEEATAEVAPTKIDITGKEFAFHLPATIRGGLVEFSFANTGQEPHFAGFGKISEGRTFSDVKAMLTAPPSNAPPPGPPPYDELAGISTIGPGERVKVTFNLPAGTYAVYCLIPSPDGTSHAAKGMLSELTVTEGTESSSLPASVGTVTATDFALHPLPPLRAGTNVVRLRNVGRQFHEVLLVELSEGKKLEDIIAWYRQQAGPPPMRYAGGVAVPPGQEATTELELKAGSTYVLICEIPDFLGDFAPHVTKGMHTQAFTVS